MALMTLRSGLFAAASVALCLGASVPLAASEAGAYATAPRWSGGATVYTTYPRAPVYAPHTVYVTPLPTVRPYIVNQGPVYSGWAVYAWPATYAPPSVRNYPYVGPPVVQYRQRYRTRLRAQRRVVRAPRIVRTAPAIEAAPIARAVPAETSPTLRNVTVKMASPGGVEEVIRSQGVVRIQGDNSVEITVFRGDVRPPDPGAAPAAEPAPAPAQALPETERFPPAGN
jgi:hypothetical protein